jgi:hypothetical protein
VKSLRQLLLVCASVSIASLVSTASLAEAAPDAATARDKYHQAVQLAGDDDNDKALELVDAGLALAPKDLPLLELRGSLLLKTRDYAGAAAAYQAYVDAGATGANRRAAQKIVASLSAVKTTFIAVTVANGPAIVYLDAKSQGEFCTADAATACKRSILPGGYRVIVERPGFERWSKQVDIAAHQTTEVPVTLVDKPSPLTLSMSPDGVRYTLDGVALDKPPATLSGGKHALVVSKDGYGSVTIPLDAHEGKPITAGTVLAPLVPLALTPADAAITIDGEPAVIEHDQIAIPFGQHTLVAHAPKYHDQTVPIPVERAAGYRVDIALAPIGALLDVSGAPAGAEIVVDGKQLAKTPLAAPVEVPPGDHAVEVRADGYRPVRERGSFVGEAHAQLHINSLRPDNRRRTYLTLGGTVVALGLGGFASAVALSRHDAYDTQARQPGVTPSDPTLRSLASSGKGFEIGADIGLGLGMVGIAATTYFFLHEGRGWSDGALRVDVGPGVAMLTGKF